MQRYNLYIKIAVLLDAFDKTLDDFLLFVV